MCAARAFYIYLHRSRACRYATRIIVNAENHVYGTSGTIDDACWRQDPKPGVSPDVWRTDPKFIYEVARLPVSSLPDSLTVNFESSEHWRMFRRTNWRVRGGLLRKRRATLFAKGPFVIVFRTYKIDDFLYSASMTKPTMHIAHSFIFLQFRPYP